VPAVEKLVRLEMTLVKDATHFWTCGDCRYFGRIAKNGLTAQAEKRSKIAKLPWFLNFGSSQTSVTLYFRITATQKGSNLNDGFASIPLQNLFSDSDDRYFRSIGQCVA
jgi:hypothetical protein